jgi:hypothetical protein
MLIACASTTDKTEVRVRTVKRKPRLYAIEFAPREPTAMQLVDSVDRCIKDIERTLVLPTDPKIGNVTDVTEGETQGVTTSENPPLRRGAFQAGPDDRRSLGGRPRAWRNFERMLNKEHRNLKKSRELMTRLRALAMGETLMMVKVGDVEMPVLRGADSSFMKLYLGRVYGAEPNMDSERIVKAIQSHLDELMREAERLEAIEQERVQAKLPPVEGK